MEQREQQLKELIAMQREVRPDFSESDERKVRESLKAREGSRSQDFSTCQPKIASAAVVVPSMLNSETTFPSLGGNNRLAGFPSMAASGGVSAKRDSGRRAVTHQTSSSSALPAPQAAAPASKPTFKSIASMLTKPTTQCDVSARPSNAPTNNSAVQPSQQLPQQNAESQANGNKPQEFHTASKNNKKQKKKQKKNQTVVSYGVSGRRN